jgi:hypothetical protein
MRYLTLEECKRHLVVEHSEDDALIERKATAAERSVEQYLQAPLSSFEEDGKLPEDIIEGILLFLGSLYNNREGFTTLTTQANASITALLKPHRRYD